jgi:hypothetical protein
MIKNCIGININEINRGIDFFRAEHDGKYPSYLVMNHATYNMMKYMIDHTIDFNNLTNNTSYSSWHGVPLAICERLDLGEVEFV